MRLATPLVVIALTLCIACLLFVTGCPKPPVVTPPPTSGPATQAPTGQPLVVGAIFSITGNGAPLGEPEDLTVRMIEKQVNDRGGINGRPLKLLIEDDASEDTKAVIVAKKLIETDKVLALVGPTISGTSLAIVPVCEQAQVPLVSCAASVKITNPVKKWAFSSAQTDVLAVERIITYLTPRKITKVAIICDSNAFGQSGAIQLNKQLPAAGIQVVHEEKFDNKATDMTAQLTKIKAAAPQAIICWGTNPGPAIIAKNAAALGLKATMIMSHGVANHKFIELAGLAAEGVVFPAGKLLVTKELPDKEPQKPTLLSFEQQFTAFAGKPANTFGGHAYDALMIVVKALETGATDRATLRDAIEKTHAYAGIGGTFNMSAGDHNGLNRDAFTLVTIRNGNWVQIK